MAPTTMKRTAAALAGAAVLASTGYALGAQAGDGSAVAASGATTTASGTTDAPPRERRALLRVGLADAAATIGVSEDRLLAGLRAVLEDRRDGGPDRREEAQAALARDLGVSPERLEQAFAALHDERHADRDAALARALGVDVARLRAAQDAAREAVEADDEHEDRRDRRAWRDRRGAYLTALAAELDLTVARVRAALRDARPTRAERRARPGRGDLAADLARALGIDAARVTAALPTRRERREGEFATALARELGVDVAKVRAAADELPFGRGPRGPGGRGGGPGFAPGPGFGG